MCNICDKPCLKYFNKKIMRWENCVTTVFLFKHRNFKLEIKMTFNSSKLNIININSLHTKTEGTCGFCEAI
jgi:hypothetical protein